MKRIIIAAALAGTTFAGIAAAQTAAPTSAAPRQHRAMALDLNKDGVITRAEVTAAADARFAQLDTNKDGKVSASERPGKNGANRPDMTRDEMRARVLARFDKADANKDGKIDTNERPTMRGKHGGRDGMAGPKGDRRIHRPGGGGGMGALMRADANKDGVITKAEMTAAASAMFDRVDTNRDGKIDQAEREAMRGQMRERMEMRRGGNGAGDMAPRGQRNGDIGAAVRDGQ